jgi:hypothetical protein
MSARSDRQKVLREWKTKSCYWLAEFYKVSPNEFLKQPMSSIRRHMKYSVELHKKLEAVKAQEQDRLDEERRQDQRFREMNEREARSAQARREDYEMRLSMGKRKR